eukprot:CAMPEP_0174968356 /NCGR_PEP_ID=MMETSP0004_2-20121128/8087_1 /TAXON_ID=420556 /ORGANISM="Ochromonas sp., Strain CCMP1393" /LENGTH=413 /DNA_ID=CAMNT_0016217577 /DNA_START=338 /DNA_END=1579 /DNA_ORIENTATION=-
MPDASPEQKICHQFDALKVDPNQMRWSPPEPITSANRADFIQGLHLMCGVGDPALKSGLSIYTYTCNASMHKKSFLNSDGDSLIVPQEGGLIFKTELGFLKVCPNEICVIPRGIKYSVLLCERDGEASCHGYVVELFQGHFELPGLGPIGANGLANARDFQAPVAWFEDIDDADYTLVNKFQNRCFQATMAHSPYDVVAWHGNYYPFKYDLTLFNCMNTVTFDHPDPSIYTVLTCPSGAEPGVAVLDFVIFPPRWMVAQNTFRPPYYHRNCMSEFMGLIYGKYDAKAGNAPARGAGGGETKAQVVEGFVPGGSSLHSCMTPHGPDTATFLKASNAPEPQPPVYFDQGLAFMFETCYMLKVAPTAAAAAAGQDTPPLAPLQQPGYSACWQSLPKLFNGSPNVSLPPPPPPPAPK